MKKRLSYIGKTKDGIGAIWTDKIPVGAIIEQEIVFYTPDEGKVFCKDDQLYDSVVIVDGVKIEDYVEIDRPVEEELTEPETEGDENGEEAE